MIGSLAFPVLSALVACERAAWLKSFSSFLGHEGGVQEEVNEAVWFST